MFRRKVVKMLHGDRNEYPNRVNRSLYPTKLHEDRDEYSNRDGETTTVQRWIINSEVFFRHLKAVYVAGGDDRPRWKLNRSGKFSVRSFYHKLFASKF